MHGWIVAAKTARSLTGQGLEPDKPFLHGWSGNEIFLRFMR